MGKGQRAREARAGKRDEMKKAAAKAVRRKKIINFFAVLSTIVLILGIIAIIVMPVACTQNNLRKTAMSTKNYKVDNAMMTYYIKNMYHTYGSSFSSSIDSSKLLKDQEYLDGTWLDQFIDFTEPQVEEMLLTAELAKKEGMKLSDEHKDEINESIKSMKSEAKTYNVSFNTYLSKVYGKGVKEKDIRKAMELATLSAQYQEDFREKNENYTDEEYEKYYKDNRSKFDTVDYYSYTFVSNNSDTEAAKKESQDFANEFKNCKTAEEFMNSLKQRLTDYYISQSTKESDEEKKTEADTNVESDLKAVENTVSYPSTEKDQWDDFSKWIFDEKTEIGNVTVLQSKENEKQFTAYMKISDVSRDENNVSNIRQLKFSGSDEATLAEAKAEAEKALAEFEKGAKDEDSFKKLVEKYAETETVKDAGGLVENVSTATTTDKALLEWAGNTERKAGDYTIIESEDGVSVVFYIKAVTTEWKNTAQGNLLNDSWAKLIEDTEKDFKVKVNDKNMKKINA